MTTLGLEAAGRSSPSSQQMRELTDVLLRWEANRRSAISAAFQRIMEVATLKLVGPIPVNQRIQARPRG